MKRGCGYPLKDYDRPKKHYATSMPCVWGTKSEVEAVSPRPYASINITREARKGLFGPQVIHKLCNLRVFLWWSIMNICNSQAKSGVELLRVTSRFLLMENSGFIKLHRKIWENPWLHKPNYMMVWIYLLTHATHKAYDVVFDGERLTLKPGQLLTGRHSISRDTGVARSSVEDILRVLESREGQIRQQKTTQNRLITIINWSKYQIPRQPSDNGPTTARQPTDTNKNVKNVKKRDASLSTRASLVIWGDFVAYWKMRVYKLYSLEYKVVGGDKKAFS